VRGWPGKQKEALVLVLADCCCCYLHGTDAVSVDLQILPEVDEEEEEVASGAGLSGADYV